MTREISEGRKTAFYLGTALQVLGGIMFASTFVIFAANFGNFSHFNETAQSSMFLAFGGMALLVVGAIIRRVGARGLAGSGTVLDPDRARQELEPYSRMAGGMIHDVLDEADVNLSGRPEKVIMVRCPSCGKLNEEDSKFCQECGKALGPPG
jgi:hypothetical protein